MKSLVALFLLIGFLNNPTIAEIRKLYPNAATTETSANELASKLAEVSTNDDKTLLAYKGAALAMTSKFKKKISQKIANMKEGAKLIESAVSSEPQNIEIRLIRLSIQENVPAIVSYKKNIPEDKAYILKHYQAQPDVLKEYVKNFISKSKSFSAEEKQAIK